VREVDLVGDHLPEMKELGDGAREDERRRPQPVVLPAPGGDRLGSNLPGPQIDVRDRPREARPGREVVPCARETDLARYSTTRVPCIPAS
jgi:hypothetical protein